MKVTVPVTNDIKSGFNNDKTYKHISYGYSPSLGCLDYVNIDTVIDRLQEFKEEYGEEYESLEFRMVNNCGCWGPCDCTPNAVLYGTREEVVDEVSVREFNEKAIKESQKESELKELERLKEKYKDK